MGSYDGAVGSSSTTARRERAALCDLLLQVGPDAPTLCAGWTTRDLAAHLVVREARPDAAAGVAGGPLAGYTARVQAQVAREPFAEVVARVRNGPPLWSPLRIGWVDATLNSLEMFVHHEDVRRAEPGWAPRVLPASTVTALWSGLSRGAWLLTRRCPVGVALHPTDGPGAGTTLLVHRRDRPVRLTGPVAECLLAVFGRVTADLTIEGDDADVAAFRAFPR